MKTSLMTNAKKHDTAKILDATSTGNATWNKILENFHAEIHGQSFLNEEDIERHQIIDAFAVKSDMIAKNLNKNDNYVQIMHSLLTDGSDLSRSVLSCVSKDIDLHVFSTLLVKSPQSMRIKENFTRVRKSSISRTILSRVKNNMTNNNYLKSVLYFGGKCCYCQSNMTYNNSRKDKATGEHIIPMSPFPDDNGTVHGTTSFGNMALACEKCNQARGTKELYSWALKNLDNTPQIEESLIKIEKFHQYAEYKKLTQDQNMFINNKINMVKDTFNNLHHDYSYLGKSCMSDDDIAFINSLCLSAVEETREKYGF